MRTAKYWIDKLHMIPHPEGGFFKETYRSEGTIKKDHLPAEFAGDRHISTSIYYLLEKDQYSKLHRIKSDEMWHFYDGTGLTIYSIDQKGQLKENKLGLNIEEGEQPQVLIKAGEWFGARLTEPDSYCLAGCTVSPGFHFDDFEMGDREHLLKSYAEHKDTIISLT